MELQCDENINGHPGQGARLLMFYLVITFHDVKDLTMFTLTLHEFRYQVNMRLITRRYDGTLYLSDKLPVSTIVAGLFALFAVVFVVA